MSVAFCIPLDGFAIQGWSPLGMRAITHPPWIHVLLLWVRSFRLWRDTLGLQDGAGRHQSGFEIAPQRHQKFARHGDDGDPPRAAFEVPDTLVEPNSQGAAWLMASPHPSQLDHHGPGFGIAGLADPLVACDGPAAERARR